MSIETTPSGAVVFTGPDVTVYQALALASGLKLLRVGIRPNTRWTPKATLAAASRITGVSYGRATSATYDAAINDLSRWIETQKPGIQSRITGTLNLASTPTTPSN